MSAQETKDEIFEGKYFKKPKYRGERICMDEEYGTLKVLDWELRASREELKASHSVSRNICMSMESLFSLKYHFWFCKTPKKLEHAYLMN